MEPRDFVYWLQGYFELAEAGHRGVSGNSLSSRQVEEIKNHLALVFKKETPIVGPITTTVETQLPPWLITDVGTNLNDVVKWGSPSNSC